MATLRLKRVHLPSFGVAALVVGGILRLFSAILVWPEILVFTSQVILLMSVVWIIAFEFFPLFLTPFYYIRENYKRRYTFFVILLALFAVMQLLSTFLPSGPAKDAAFTIAFLSFVSSIFWVFSVYIMITFTPVVKYLKRKPKEPERITFSDVITSMAVIIAPTVLLSFYYSSPGLATPSVTPSQIFVTSLVTCVFMLAYIYLFVIRTRVFSWRQLGLKKVNREHMGEAYLLFLLVSIVIVLIQALLRRFEVPINQFSFTTKEGAYLALFSSVVITPFIEEVYFRGFLFRGLQMHHKNWVAYVVSAGLFALLHPPLIVMLEVFVIGILLAYVADKTKSIWPGVVIHAVNNAIVIGYLLFR